MRKNPMAWEDVEEAQGVLSPSEGLDEGGPSLLGLSGQSMLTARDVRPDADAGPAVREALARVADALAEAADHGTPAWQGLDDLLESDRQVLFDALGTGEVSMVLAGAGPHEGEAQIYETVLPGVWVGQAESKDGAVRTHWLEVADAPRALRQLAKSRPRDGLTLEGMEPPRGAMNVMSVLAEVDERAQAWQPGEPNHVMNFTLFPMTPADSAFLASTLGEVGVRISSGGYGAARVILTGVRHVWAVQYLNGLGATILDTLEVGDVPAAVLASMEDFADSAARLAEIQKAYEA